MSWITNILKVARGIVALVAIPLRVARRWTFGLSDAEKQAKFLAEFAKANGNPALEELAKIHLASSKGPLQKLFSVANLARGAVLGVIGFTIYGLTMPDSWLNRNSFGLGEKVHNGVGSVIGFVTRTEERAKTEQVQPAVDTVNLNAQQKAANAILDTETHLSSNSITLTHDNVAFHVLGSQNKLGALEIEGNTWSSLDELKQTMDVTEQQTIILNKGTSIIPYVFYRNDSNPSQSAKDNAPLAQLGKDAPVLVVVDGNVGYMDYAPVKAAQDAAKNSGSLSYNQNGMTITQGTDPSGPPPTVTVQHPGHKGDGLALAFGALAVGYVGGGALRGKPNAKSGNGPKPKGPDVPHAANDHVLHVSESEIKAGEDMAKAAMKDAAKAEKFAKPLFKLGGRKLPIIGAFIAAAFAITAVKAQLEHKNFAQAGVEAVNGVIDTVGSFGGFMTGFVSDGLHEGVRSAAIALGGDQFRVLSKSGTREMAEGAVNVAGAIMAQRPANAPVAPQAAGLHT